MRAVRVHIKMSFETRFPDGGYAENEVEIMYQVDLNIFAVSKLLSNAVTLDWER